MAQFVEKNTFDINDNFFVNFYKDASKQQKTLVYLYVAQFDENNTFMTLMTSFFVNFC